LSASIYDQGLRITHFDFSPRKCTKVIDIEEGCRMILELIFSYLEW